MSDGARTLGEIAAVVRSKNAGPFWITLDVFFRTDADFAHVRDSHVLTVEKIGQLYGVDPSLVKGFELPEITGASATSAGCATSRWGSAMRRARRRSSRRSGPGRIIRPR